MNEEMQNLQMFNGGIREKYEKQVPEFFTLCDKHMQDFEQIYEVLVKISTGNARLHYDSYVYFSNILSYQTHTLRK